MAKQHKHHDLIIAWAKGAEIQLQYLDGIWEDVAIPSWADDVEYRIKDKFQDLKDAFEGGAKIQYKHPDEDDSHWKPASSPIWSPMWDYRIKPEPKPDVIEERFIKLHPDKIVTISKYTPTPNVRFTFDGETTELIKVEKI